MKHTKPSYLPAYLTAHLGAEERDALTFADQVQTWFATHLKALARLASDDARAILGWQLRALEDAAQVFGMRCPTCMIVTAAGGHLLIDQDLSPAYCTLREGLRQRDAVVRVTSQLAHDDTTWEVLLAPILEDAALGTTVDDTALLILLEQHFGSAADVVWRVLQAWHQERFNCPPRMTRAEYDAHLAIGR